MKGSSCCSARAVSFSYHSPTKETSPDVGWSTMLALRYRLLPEIPSQGEPAQKTCVASSTGSRGVISYTYIIYFYLLCDDNQFINIDQLGMKKIRTRGDGV